MMCFAIPLLMCKMRKLKSAQNSDGHMVILQENHFLGSTHQ